MQDIYIYYIWIYFYAQRITKLMTSNTVFIKVLDRDWFEMFGNDL